MSIKDRITAEIVVEALNTRPRKTHSWKTPAEAFNEQLFLLQKPVLHPPVESGQFRFSLFGHRLRQAGLLGSMGRVAPSVDNALVESFSSTMQLELLDRSTWTSRTELASAMFEWIEGFHNPTLRHTALDNLPPIEFENLHTAANAAA